MLIIKVKEYAQSLMDEGKTKEEIDALVKEFIGDEDITNEDGDSIAGVSFKMPEKEKETIDIELEVKKEVEKQIKAAPKIEAKILETKDVGITFPDNYKSKTFKGDNAGRKAFMYGHYLKGILGGNKESRKIYSQMSGQKWTQVEGTDARGGFLVPEEWASEILELSLDYGVYRRNARNVNMKHLIMNVQNVSTGLFVGLVTEGADKDERNKEFANTQLTAKKVASITPFSDELLDDAPQNLLDFFSENLARAHAEREDHCGFVGNGVADVENCGITGIVTAIQAVAGNAGVTTIDGSFGDITMVNMTDFMATLPSHGYTKGRTKWYCHQSVYYRTLARLAAGVGGNTIRDIEGGFSPSFLGYPVEFVEVMRADDGNPSAPGVCLLFGDLYKAALFGNRQELTFKTYEREVSDETVIRTVRRFDAATVFPGTAAAAGPVVALELE